MEHYVGLDVSLRLTALCIVDRTGNIEREGVVASNPEAIAAFVKSHAPQVARIGRAQGRAADHGVAGHCRPCSPSALLQPGEKALGMALKSRGRSAPRPHYLRGGHDRVPIAPR